MALARKLTTKIYEIQAHTGDVTCLDLGETGRVLVTGGLDCNVNLWAIGQEECFMSLPGHNRPLDCVRFAYNDDYVYSADDTGVIRRWDLNAQTICSTLHGHMKSVRTLDFNPSGEYVVSGSADTTVRLWDVRNQNKYIKVYRGHIAQVNSVKFSPDGMWIASAGTEGSVIVWDIRKSKQIMQFIEHPPPTSAITCIQFHPYEFLLAVGYIDGSICIYDLETQKRVTKTTVIGQHPIKCITFSENGECLFAGTAGGISVIGWEPDREYDNIKSSWTVLCDMKVVNRRLLCGSYEREFVAINALSIDRVFPFYNPSNEPAQTAFTHNSTTRKSFSRGNQKLRLSIGGAKPPRVAEETEDNKSPSLDGHSSPNLSLELVDDSSYELTRSTPPPPMLPTSELPRTPPPPPAVALVEPQPPAQFNGFGNGNGNLAFDATYNVTTASSNSSSLLPLMKKSTSSLYQYPLLATGNSTYYTSLGGIGMSSLNFDGPSSLKMPGERGDSYLYDRMMNKYTDEMEYNLNDSNPPIITNYEHTEMLEDFPVNQNGMTTTSASTTHTLSNAHNSGSTTTTTTTIGSHVTSTKTNKHKITSNIQKRSTQISIAGTRTTNAYHHQQQQRGRLSQSSSVSTTDLHKLEDNVLLKKSVSSHVVNNKGKRSLLDTDRSAAALLNKENARNKNINVQIMKPPTRSRTSLELRSPPQAGTGTTTTPSANTAGQRQSHRNAGGYAADADANAMPPPYAPTAPSNVVNIPISYRPDPSLFTQPGVGGGVSGGGLGVHNKSFNGRNGHDDSSEIQMLATSHEQICQELSNRHATLQLIRNSTRQHDIVGALKQAIKINGRTIFVDILGAILEKTSSWNLDLCLLLLPEIYELLQSQHKFHYTRACDTLRVILSTFLPIIQENLDPWANGLGVDVSREERTRKCVDCQHWLLQIRNLPESSHFGTTLSQLQNMIVKI